ncbi:TIGR03118 family protein [Leptolyngbya sp. NK1-12]|uniref:TIGR03118 family protein n=1 Tax=Leptolyngbya sp. NK1-12 TaxID=2547451 RepID=A0AA97ADZ3_9CYAN|nr:TIGR03118 family protein [Leptolyngbya sp. NK1-12]WNZ21420.1 TIGR03118 family protein [Leptolyngbya sp. NK1-12]
MTSTAQSGYLETTLASNNPNYDPQLLDPYVQLAWGIAIRPAGFGGHFWVNNSATGTVTEYVGDVRGIPIYQDALKVVDIPFAPGNPFEVSGPTGQVFNGSNEFVITQDHPNGEITAASKFIFVTTDGSITAWTERKNPDGTFDWPSEAEIVINQFGSAIYYGVAITDFEQNNRLYAVDFDDTPSIQVYDGNFQDISDQVQFTNPFAVEGYAAYNIQTLGDSLYVTYAQPLPDVPGDELVGPGLGKLAQFDFDGNLIATWDDGGLLNAPWGLAIAPADFGEFSNTLLVTNFGDGTIVAFDQTTRQPLGYLEDPKGDPIAIPGIWGILFGNGASLGETNHLYYAAGPDTGPNAGDGLFGKIQPADTVTTFPGGDSTFSGNDQDDLFQIGGDNNLILAGEGNNTVTARGVNQTVYAGSGNDIISIGSGIVYAGEGTNFVATSNGVTTIYAGAGDDTLNAVRGNTTIYAGDGANTVITGAGDDLIYAGAGDDVIHAGAGTNTIYLGEGNNSITSVGNDTIYAGSGIDTWTLSPGEGVATIFGFGSNDKINLSGFNSDFTGALTAADLSLEQVGTDAVIKITATDDVLAILKWTQVNAISSSNFQ